MRWWEALLQFWTASGDRCWGVVVGVQSLSGVAGRAKRGGPEAGEGARKPGPGRREERGKATGESVREEPAWGVGGCVR